MKPNQVSFELTMSGEIDKLEVDLQDIVVVTLDINKLSPTVERELRRKLAALLGSGQEINLKTKGEIENNGQTSLF